MGKHLQFCFTSWEGRRLMNRCMTTLGVWGAVLSLAGVCQATIVGFGQLGGNNTTVPAALGSNAVADGNGYVVSNGTTPNVALTWDSDWDIHTSNFFAPLEGQTVGGGDWDNQGNIPRIGQLDFGTHTIVFAADAGYAVVLNSFDFHQLGPGIDRLQRRRRLEPFRRVRQRLYRHGRSELHRRRGPELHAHLQPHR